MQTMDENPRGTHYTKRAIKRQFCTILLGFIRKEFDIQRFINNYPVKLNGKQKRQIKEFFIDYLKILYQEAKLQDKVIDLSSDTVLRINDLNSSYLQIAVFETIHFDFRS